MSRWNRWRALSPADRRLRLAALRVIAAARVRLWLRPFPAVRAWAERAAAPAAPGSPAPSPSDVDRAVRSAASLVPGSTCLVKALAARVLLGRAGIPAGIRLGVARDGAGGLDAHAWVECADGTVVGERGRPDYAALPL